MTDALKAKATVAAWKQKPSYAVIPMQDLYAPVKNVARQPTAQELNQAREGDFYARNAE
jgi:hypothetical protein